MPQTKKNISFVYICYVWKVFADISIFIGIVFTKFKTDILDQLKAKNMLFFLCICQKLTFAKNVTNVSFHGKETWKICKTCIILIFFIIILNFPFYGKSCNLATILSLDFGTVFRCPTFQSSCKSKIKFKIMFVCF